jgi:hypothetical protein
VHKLCIALGASAILFTTPLAATEIFDESDDCSRANCRATILNGGVGAIGEAA